MRAFQQQPWADHATASSGPATYRALREAGWTLGDRMLALLISTPMSGDDVVALQEQLLELGYDTGRPSGVFDEQTERGAARVPARLLRHLGRRLRAVDAARAAPARARRVKGGRPHLLREQELLRQAGPRAARQADRRSTPGTAARTAACRSAGVTEADLMWDLARRLEGRMAATGMEALLTRREDTCPTEAERAAFANAAGADLVLSLHVDANRSMHAEGLATFHFGNGSGVTSTVGEALAGLHPPRARQPDGDARLGTQARTWELLRLTRMPTVRVEIGYLTNLGDRRRLLDPAFRDVVAEGDARRRSSGCTCGAGRPADRHVHLLGRARPRTGPRGDRPGDLPPQLEDHSAPLLITRQRPSERALRAPLRPRRSRGTYRTAGYRRRCPWTAAEG